MNYPHIIPFVEEHLNELSANKKNKRENERAHHSSFHNWFSDHVQGLIPRGNEISDVSTSMGVAGDHSTSNAGQVCCASLH